MAECQSSVSIWSWSHPPPVAFSSCLLFMLQTLVDTVDTLAIVHKLPQCKMYAASTTWYYKCCIYVLHLLGYGNLEFGATAL